MRLPFVLVGTVVASVGVFVGAVIIHGAVTKTSSSPAPEVKPGQVVYHAAPPQDNATLPSQPPGTSRRATQAVKRDWRGVVLGTSRQVVQGSATPIGYSMVCSEPSTKQIARYEATQKGWTLRPPALLAVYCYLKARKPQPREISVVNLTFLADSLYEIEMYVPNGETFDGVSARMTEVFGPATFRGALTETIKNPWKDNVEKYEGLVWEDAQTAVLLYNVVVGSTDKPSIAFLNRAMQPVLDQSDRGEDQRKASEKEKEKAIIKL